MEKLPKSAPNPWTINSETVKYQNPWIKVTEFGVVHPGGGPGIYGTVHFKNIAVGVLPIDDEGFTYLVGQYRFPLRHYSWEIPEGGGPLDVSPLVTAARELAEETGLKAKTWEKLVEMHLSNSVSDEWGIIYLATGLTPGPSQPDEDEQLEVRRVPFLQVYDWVVSGEITDSLTVAAVLRARLLIYERGTL